MTVIEWCLRMFGLITGIGLGSGLLFVIVLFLVGDVHEYRERAEDYKPDE